VTLLNTLTLRRFTFEYEYAIMAALTKAYAHIDHAGAHIARKEDTLSMLPAARDLLRTVLGETPLTDGTPTPGPELTPTTVAEAVATPTPAALPPGTATGPSPWQPDQWLRTTGWTADFHGFFLVMFLLIAIAAVVVYFFVFQRRWRGHKLNGPLAERVSLILTAFAAVGLLLLLAAQARLGFLSWPLLLILTGVSFLAAAFYGVYYYASVYPLRLAAYKREQDRERYIPKPRVKGPAQRPPMKKKQDKRQRQVEQQKQKEQEKHHKQQRRT